MNPEDIIAAMQGLQKNEPAVDPNSNSIVKDLEKNKEALKKNYSLAEAQGFIKNFIQAYPELLKFKRENNFRDKMSRNANEVLATTQTGFGAELVPDQVLMNEALNMIPTYSRLVRTLPGFHGFDMQKSETRPIVGEVPFMQGNTEWTTGQPIEDQARLKLPTAEIDINQVPLIGDVAISKRLLNYSIIDVEEQVRRSLAQSAARTVDSMIINGDSEAGATGNVNSDDQAPATTFAATGAANDHRLLIDHGIRELAINGTGLTHNVGTLAWDDFISIVNILGDLASNPEDLLWLMNRPTYNKCLTLTEFKDASLSGQSIIFNGSIANFLGSDVHIARDMPKTEADGKASATPSNNTLGQIGCIYRPAIQFGYGQNIDNEAKKVVGKGIQLVSTMEVGFTIAQLKAGQTDSSVALGINVTL